MSERKKGEEGKLNKKVHKKFDLPFLRVRKAMLASGFYFIASLASRCPRTRPTSKDLLGFTAGLFYRARRCEKPRLTPRSSFQRSNVEANIDPQMAAINRDSVHKAPHLGWPRQVPRPVGEKIRPTLVQLSCYAGPEQYAFLVLRSRRGRGEGN